jgi:hypothetical protein
MTIPRYVALQDHWRKYPRPEWLIAGYIGFKPKADPKIIQSTPGERMRLPAAPAPTGAMMTLFNSLGGKPGKTVVLSA